MEEDEPKAYTLMDAIVKLFQHFRGARQPRRADPTPRPGPPGPLPGPDPPDEIRPLERRKSKHVGGGFFGEGMGIDDRVPLPAVKVEVEDEQTHEKKEVVLTGNLAYRKMHKQDTIQGRNLRSRGSSGGSLTGSLSVMGSFTGPQSQSGRVAGLAGIYGGSSSIGEEGPPGAAVAGFGKTSLGKQLRPSGIVDSGGGGSLSGSQTGIGSSRFAATAGGDRGSFEGEGSYAVQGSSKSALRLSRPSYKEEEGPSALSRPKSGKARKQ